MAGDAAYNGVHLYLAESNPQTRRKWIAALDEIEALKPRAVIAGQKKPENDDNPRIIEETRQYIYDFDRLAKTSTTARVFATRCWSFIRIGSIGRPGLRRAGSNRKMVRTKGVFLCGSYNS